jgi:hypothetical protein
MSNGGMIQTQRRDGTRKDAFATSYKPETAALNVARKTTRPTRIVNKDGKVIFKTGESDD